MSAKIRMGEMFADDEIKSAALRVLDSGQYIKGPEVEAFEREFAAATAIRHAAACSSGTAALHLAYMAIGLKPGDEVIVPSHTFIATAAPLMHMGVRPVFADIDSATYTIDPAHARRLVTPRTKAIVPVHLYGQPAEMAPLVELADAKDLYLIEDAAQAHLAVHQGKPVGSFGDLTIYSFFPSKNMTVAGDGGMVTTPDAELDLRIRMLRDAGRRPGAKYEHEIAGFNFRLSELPCAIGRVQLRHLPDWTKRRRANAAYLRKELQGAIATPQERRGDEHVYHQFVVRSPHREALKKDLAASGIETGVHYPLPVHRQPAFASLPAVSLPHTDKAAAEILSLPVHQFLRPEDLDRIVAGVRAFGAKA